MTERVIIDTSAFYALVSSTDSFHLKAYEQYENLIDREAELYTTSYVLLETSALVHRRLGFEKLKALVKSVQDIVKIEWITKPFHSEAWNMMIARNGARISLVDCSIIIAARKLGALVFAFDDDLASEGINLIPR